MKVILRENVPQLGSIGDVVEVRDGYARNYLIPRQLAYYASESALKRIEIERKHYERKQQRLREQAELTAAQLAELQISIPMRVGEEGKLFGSVTPQMIADELALRGFQIDRRSIIIEEPIKTLGIYEVKVRLFQDIVGTLKIWVISQE
ncbi:MAG: 50S ribosomal protein L9 [Bacteroidota bacterium]|nr:50S ribosomal protein L9 [Candidatus Kapabacteria bacterium]MCS7302692.1 50S ribosomal protein L9 [Candidatus Kapabacteria bacterium]MCX7936200.1 50S ribosomal protein L9 [Chlorobiota bacterium]MDW8074906.1 50S ribosomal protein L9 [Bacteroidota bacterium]MDW8271545.1 50S ribosomal protein L9 [Bacteroidota bacterium]